ncbi:unnamed protein product [Rhodiola kirilowii]
MHPHWQVLARDEVLRVCGSRDVPTKDDVVKLKTLTMILNESLRLYPPSVATSVDEDGRRARRVQSTTWGRSSSSPILAVHHEKGERGATTRMSSTQRDFADGVREQPSTRWHSYHSGLESGRASVRISPCFRRS